MVLYIPVKNINILSWYVLECWRKLECLKEVLFVVSDFDYYVYYVRRLVSRDVLLNDKNKVHEEEM